MNKYRDIMNECYRCKNKENVPRNCHIKCNAPDPFMTGQHFGVVNSWFDYPALFDPIWKEKLCDNFAEKENQ